MNFPELQLQEDFSLVGRDSYDKALFYNNMIRSYIKGMAVWKNLNEERKKQFNDNKDVRVAEDPNRDAEILAAYLEHMESSERIRQYELVLSLGKGDRVPTAEEFAEISLICMGEMIITTGMRPVAVYRMPNQAYYGKDEGFNPYIYTDKDETTQDERIRTRVDPRLPPWSLACEHQRSDKSAQCSVHCDLEYFPDGYNMRVTWDKNYKNETSSYIHIIKNVKFLLDHYQLAKNKFFADKFLNGEPALKVLKGKEATFFVKPCGSAYTRVTFDHLSTTLGVDVVAYDFRNLASSWAQNHKLEEIRLAESVVFRHKPKIAQERYRTNQQLPAQMLIQTFNAEEGTCPESLDRLINDSVPEVIEQIREEEAEGKRIRLDQKKDDQKKHTLNLLRLRTLSSKNRTRYIDRMRFSQAVEKACGDSVEKMAIAEKWSSWRRKIVRLVYSTEGDVGAELRDVWIDFYRGDLLNGVRDGRFLAKSKNWPRHTVVGLKRDRDSFIAGAVYLALKSDFKLLNGAADDQ